MHEVEGTCKVILLGLWALTSGTFERLIQDPRGGSGERQQEQGLTPGKESTSAL